jgi:hypothetical protein
MGVFCWGNCSIEYRTLIVEARAIHETHGLVTVRKLATLAPRWNHLTLPCLFLIPLHPFSLILRSRFALFLPALVTVNPRTHLANPRDARRPVLGTNPFGPASFLHFYRGIWSGCIVSVPGIVLDCRFFVGRRLVAYWDSSGCRGTCCGAALERGCLWSGTEDSHHGHCGSRVFWLIIFFEFLGLMSFEEALS